MKILFLSDIHANLTALEAVMADVAELAPIDAIWVSGDTVGYGPDPNECIELVRESANMVVAGNHELAAIGKMSTEEFNAYAAAATDWTQKCLTDSVAEYIAEMPLRLEHGDFTLVHGSPRDPVWEYLLTDDGFRANLDHFETPGCVVGHSHMQFMVQIPDDGAMVVRAEQDVVVNIGDDRFFINPGSVGQPRDGDPRAAYAIYDEGERTVTFKRVEYDIGATQKRMESAGLPEVLADRLSHGR